MPPPKGHKAMMPFDVCLSVCLTSDDVCLSRTSGLAGPGPAAHRAQPMWAWFRAVNHQAALCGWAGHIVAAAAGHLVILVIKIYCFIVILGVHR